MVPFGLRSARRTQLREVAVNVRGRERFLTLRLIFAAQRLRAREELDGTVSVTGTLLKKCTLSEQFERFWELLQTCIEGIFGVGSASLRRRRLRHPTAIGGAET